MKQEISNEWLRGRWSGLVPGGDEVFPLYRHRSRTFLQMTNSFSDFS